MTKRSTTILPFVFALACGATTSADGESLGVDTGEACEPHTPYCIDAALVACIDGVTEPIDCAEACRAYGDVPAGCDDDSDALGGPSCRCESATCNITDPCSDDGVSFRGCGEGLSWVLDCRAYCGTNDACEISSGATCHDPDGTPALYCDCNCEAP